MPIYEYEPTEHDCCICLGRFEALQTASEPALEHCPACGMPVIRVVSRAATPSAVDITLPGRAARKGLTTFRKSEEGVWERIAGEGVDVIVGTEDDKKAIEKERNKIDLDASS